MGMLSLFNNFDLTTAAYILVAYFAIITIAITVHEFMHAWSATYLGDSTPRYAGRVTLNPIAHLDLLGSLMLVFFGFGWGKPVPINPNNFQNPRTGSALVSLAGPFSNLALALFFGFIYNIPGVAGTILGDLSFIAIGINLLLMIFNLIPVPPLDGSKVFALIFPKIEENPQLQSYGILIVLAFVFFGGATILSQIVGFFRNLIIGG